MKKWLSIFLACVMAASMFAGCAEKTPEQIEQERLEIIAQEEAETGLKRLDSPNFTDYEIPLQMLVQGIKEGDGKKICKAVGSPYVLADDDIYGWVLQSGLDYIQQMEASELRMKSDKENATATITIYEPDDNPKNAESGHLFTVVYESGEWILSLDSGVVNSYAFTSPSKEVSCGDASLRQYATSVDAQGNWSFRIPHMIVTDTMENFKLSTQLGEFDAMIVTSPNGYTTIPELIVEMNQQQKTEYATVAQQAFQKVFDLLKAGADKTQLSSALVSERMIRECFPASDAEKAALAEKLATVTGVEVYPGDPTNQYPDAYVYRVNKDNGVELDVKLRILTDTGECRKVATVVLQLLNNEWRISDVRCADGRNPFTSFSVYDPEW